MNRPRVLVLLAAYNGAKWIVQQVETILNQRYVDVRLIVSDDGSQDDTLTRMRQFASDSRVSLVAQAAPTGSAARNFIWLVCNTPASDFDFVALADQDDIWHADKLASACAALDSCEAAGYSCSVSAIWNDGRRKTQMQVPTPRALDFMFEGAGQGCTFVLRAAFFSRVQSFFTAHPRELPELHYHDWAIYALSRCWGLTWRFDAQPRVDYRQHDGNDTGVRFGRGGIVRRIRLIKSGWYRKQMTVIARIASIAAPGNRRIEHWTSLLSSPVSVNRQLRIAAICLLDGRRRLLDRFVITSAALAGWL